VYTQRSEATIGNITLTLAGNTLTAFGITTGRLRPDSIGFGGNIDLTTTGT
jgi:hypothetical protein